MKHYILIFLLASLCACQQKTNKQNGTDQTDTTEVQTASLSADSLIAPGERIGLIALGGDMDSVEHRLGKAYRSDGAMGSALLTWYDKNDTTAYQTRILGTRNMGGKDENILHIKKVMVTSPHYRTADSIHTGLDLAIIQKHYDLQQKAQIKIHGHTVNIYADVAKGIGFEINTLNNMCVGIAVFNPGDEPTSQIAMR